MKKFLLSLFLLISLAVTAAAAGTDIINYSFLSGGKTTDKTAYAPALTTGTATSGAQYYGKVLYKTSGSSKYIQFNCGGSGSDLVTIKSGGIAKSVKITWSTAQTTSTGNKVNVYGLKTAYSSTSDSKGEGTLIATATKGRNASETLDLSSQPYEFIAINAPKATYIESIEIEWVAAEKDEVPVTSDDVVVTYNPNSPTLDLSNNLPAEILETATLTFTGAEKYINREGIIIASNADAAGDQTVNVAWTETATYKANNHDFTFLIDKAEPALAYSAETATATMGEAAELPALSNPYNLKVEYTSLYEEVATVGADGVVELVAPGETIIEAAFSGNELFNQGAAEYTLTVQEAGLPATPEFSFTDEGTYKIDQKLAITTATEDAEIYYSFDGDNYIKYEGEISFDKAGAYTVFAYAKNAKGQSTTAEILFTIEMYTYDYAFGEVAEQMVGRDRYFTMPALVGAEGVAVKYDVLPDDGVLLAVPGEEGKYFITGAGDVMVTAEIAGNANYDDFTAETTVKVVPQITKIETANIFDYQNYKSIGLSDPTDGQYIYIADNEEIKVGNVVMTTVQGSGTTPSRIVVNNDASKTYFAIYRPTTTNGKGGSMTFTASDIVKIEITFLSYPNVVVAETEGTFTDAVDNVRVWTPKEGSVNSATFYTTYSGDKNQKWNPQIAKVVVYTMSEGGETAQPFDMAFSAEMYDLEEGDLMPNVVLPDDFTGEVKYLVNGEPKNVGYRFPASEEAYEIVAYTEGDAKRLPAVDKTIVYAYGYELADVLAIHYSTENTPVHYSTVAYSAPKTIDGDVHRYEFTDIDVKGYDGVDGKTYGHVFFSFTPAPGEAPALAPRREAAEGDWASFNANTDIYSAATHLTEAGENTPLVRHRAGTLGDAMPAVFRVQSSAETGQMYNFTVNLDKNGTSSVTAVQSQTQTGVESVGVDADGEAEYYTLQGVRVAKPAAGIYLRRQGGTVSKVLVK